MLDVNRSLKDLKDRDSLGAHRHHMPRLVSGNAFDPAVEWQCAWVGSPMNRLQGLPNATPLMTTDEWNSSSPVGGDAHVGEADGHMGLVALCTADLGNELPCRIIFTLCDHKVADVKFSEN